jgi:hypothetical protein
LHTPSAPTVESPASATDPRYSTSGILNAEIKEKYRQGMLSNYSGRTGNFLDINKFANIKNERNDPRAVSILEKVSALYAEAAKRSHGRGVDNSNTAHEGTAEKNIRYYNESVDAVNNYLKQYGVDDSGLVKGGRTHNYDKRQFVHDNNEGAANKDEIKKSVDSIGKTGDVFNSVAEQYKKKNQATTK